MDESIIDSIKDYLGISKADEAFDQDIVLHINSTFSTLYQLGVGTNTPFRVFVDDDITWDELFKDYLKCVPFIQEYTYLKVRLLFDPPTNSSLLDSLKQSIQEIEYRLLLELEGCFDDE